jgi:hypothetical protein
MQLDLRGSPLIGGGPAAAHATFLAGALALGSPPMKASGVIELSCLLNVGKNTDHRIAQCRPNWRKRPARAARLYLPAFQATMPAKLLKARQIAQHRGAVAPHQE